MSRQLASHYTLQLVALSCLTLLSVLHKLSRLPPTSRRLVNSRSTLNGKRLFWSGVMSTKTKSAIALNAIARNPYELQRQAESVVHHPSRVRCPDANRRTLSPSS